MPELDGQQLWEADGDSAIDLVSPGFQWGFPGGSDGKESACNTGDPGSVPGLGRSLGAGNGNPLQYFCLENPMDRGDWRATVHGVAESWMWLSIHTHTHTHTHTHKHTVIRQETSSLEILMVLGLCCLQDTRRMLLLNCATHAAWDKHRQKWASLQRACNKNLCIMYKK